MHFQAAVAKIGKYATSESGDTFEMIERPLGGMSFVLADGQRSGRGAKVISSLAAQKAIALLAEGVRDGAAARAAHDYLYIQRGGKVSATLNIVSVDLETKTLVISRNTHCPVIVQQGPGRQFRLDVETAPIGVRKATKPEITELPLEPGLVVVAFTDGLLAAGSRQNHHLDVAAIVEQAYLQHFGSPEAAQAISEALLQAAVALDEGRPQDDTSVLVVAVLPHEAGSIRKMHVSVPIPPLLRP